MSKPDEVRAAYDAYTLHIAPNKGPKCEGCCAARNPTEGCDRGRELWGAYRLTRITRFMTAR